jgi:hypothetical protein
LKEEYSKTLGRTVGLYWVNSLQAVKDFIDERIREGIKSDDPVYDSTYNAARLFLVRLGKRVLNKRIHFHLFRHSSATYYANKLNRQELCYRYGWRFSSRMPDTYISRSGMMEKQVEEKFSRTELAELQSKLLLQEQQNKIMAEKIVSNETKTGEIAQKLNLLLEVFKNNMNAVKMVTKNDKEILKQIFR